MRQCRLVVAWVLHLTDDIDGYRVVLFITMKGEALAMAAPILSDMSLWRIWTSCTGYLTRFNPGVPPPPPPQEMSLRAGQFFLRECWHQCQSRSPKSGTYAYQLCFPRQGAVGSLGLQDSGNLIPGSAAMSAALAAWIGATLEPYQLEIGTAAQGTSLRVMGESHRSAWLCLTGLF